MFDLVVISCRYLFVFYVAYFLWQALKFLGDERGIKKNSRTLAVSKQRVTIVFMHLTAFLILAYIPGELTFDRDTLLTGGLGLAFLLFSYFALGFIYKGGCPLLWNGMLFLMDTGLIAIERIQRISRLNSLTPALSQRQLMWFFTGVIITLVIPLALAIISRSDKLGIVYLLASYALLLSPFIIGVSYRGAVNWIQLGSISFQPSEIVKFLFIFYLASAFRNPPSQSKTILSGVFSAGMVLILVLQTDLGGALIFFMSFMVTLYIATGSGALFLLGMGAASAASYLAWQLFSHVKIRVAAWQNPWQDIDGGGYQIVQSLFAIGTWGLLGSGLTRGVPGLVPVAESDFIFAAICEEFGSLFGMGIIGVFLLIFYRGVHISLRARSRYYALLAAGFTAMLAFQTFLILGGVIKLIPLTGVTLPFVSYGGSSVVVSTLMIGILQWIHTHDE